jgi:hypothetical protein
MFVAHPDRAGLTQYELSEARRWLRSWWRSDRPAYVIMACSAERGRDTRLRRLQEQLLECGLPPEAVRYTDERVQALWVGGEPSPRSDLVWFKAIDPAVAGRGVRSIRSLFEGEHTH